MKRLIALALLVASYASAAAWYVGSTKWTAVTAWAATTAYNVGDLRRQLATPAVGSERVFRCTTAGTSGGTEPTWVTTAGATTSDGSAVWTEVTGQSTYGWTAPHARLANALASGWGAAGDTFYLSSSHAETQAAAMTLIFPGTANSPNRVYSVNDSAAPPTALAAGAAITTTGSSTQIINMSGVAYVRGVAFSVGTGAGMSGNVYNFASSTLPVWFRFEDSSFRIGNSSASLVLAIGSVDTVTSKDVYIEWVNTSFSVAAVTHRITVAGGTFIWRDTATPITGGIIPTSVFVPPTTTRGARVEVSGVDFSSIVTGKALVDVSTSTGKNHRYLISNSKLGSGGAITTGTIANSDAVQVAGDLVDAAGATYSHNRTTYQGTVLSETALVMTAGASDGTTTVSDKMTTTSGASLIYPLEEAWSAQWNSAIGSQVTARVEFLHDSATALTNADIWLEVEYLGASGSTKTTTISSGVASEFATATAYTTSSTTWTTTGMSNANRQYMEVQFTPAVKGLIRWRVKVAKASYTAYVNPALSVTGATISRTWLLPTRGFVVETGGGVCSVRVSACVQ